MEFSARFKAISYKEENVGKLIKFSKRKFTWELKMNSKHCFIVLKVSKITNNYSVELNKQLLYNGNNSYDENFEFKFKLEGIMLNIKLIGNNYVLYIQYIPFMDFYEDPNGRQTKLLKPEFTPNSDDFDQPSIEKRFRSMNISPVKNRLIDNIVHNSSPVKAFNKTKEIKNANESAKDNKIIEELVKDKKRLDDMTFMIKEMTISVDSTETDSNTVGDEMRPRGKTFEFRGKNDLLLEVCKELDSECENYSCEDKKGVNHPDGDSRLKESMEIVLYPCDFDNHNANTENVIRVLYNR